MPPLPTEKFHPMYSPTSTMPTPSAQTWPGPSTRRRPSLSGASAAETLLMKIPSELKQFQQKCAAVLRPELREKRELDDVRWTTVHRASSELVTFLRQLELTLSR